MAYVVRRPNNRFEIRESRHTADGPRARTLASFAELDDGVLDRAERTAETRFDRNAVVASARRAGARVSRSRADRLARDLVHELRRGRGPTAGLSRLLADELAPPPQPREYGDLADWLDASDEERGRSLRDLMELTDSLPHRRSGPLKYPPPRRRNE